MFDSKFLSFAERLKEFIGRETKARQESRPTEREFNALAVELFGLQFEAVPPYQSYCRAAGISPAQIDDWRSIPALPISAFKDFEVTSLRPEDRTTVFYSSGTTGQRRSRNLHSDVSLELYRTSALRWAREFLIESGAASGMLFLTPTASVGPGSSLAYMFDALGQAFAGGNAEFVGTLGRDETWVIDFGRATAALQKTMAANQPVGILGTAYNFVHLIEHASAGRHRFQLPAGSWALETGGYKGRSRSLPRNELYAAIQDVFGIPTNRIISEYGMCELSSQAYKTSNFKFQISNPPVFRFPPWVRTRAVSPETGQEAARGQPGLLQVFDLANVRSVLAIQTEDIAIAHENGFELIGRASGAEQRGCSLMAAEAS